MTATARPAADWRWYVAACAAGLTVVVGLWWLAHRTVYPLLPDSTAYLEMARSFVEHGRFEVVPYGLASPEVAREATTLWPPFFPVVLGVFARVGIDATTAAPWVNRGCFGLLPALVLWAFSSVASSRRLAVAGVLALTAPSVMMVQYFALSEGLCAVLLIAAMGCALRGEGALFLSGVFAGLAYITRNPAIGVCVAIPLWIALEGWRSPRMLVRRLAFWLAGAVLAIGPVWIYNLRTFGAVQPYQAPASTVGFFTNLRLLTATLAGDLVGIRRVDGWVGVPTVAVLVLGAAMIVAVKLWRERAGRDRSEQRAIRLLLLYVAAMCAVLVVAASRFAFQGLDDHRFVAPILWAVLAIGAIAAPVGERSTLFARGSVVVVALLFVSRGYDSWRREQRRPRTIIGATAVAGDVSLGEYQRARAGDADFVASNAAWVLRASFGTTTRQLVSCPDYDAQLPGLLAIAAAGRPVTVITTESLAGADCEREWPAALERSGFSRLRSTETSTIFRRAPSAP